MAPSERKIASARTYDSVRNGTVNSNFGTICDLYAVAAVAAIDDVQSGVDVDRGMYQLPSAIAIVVAVATSLYGCFMQNFSEADARIKSARHIFICFNSFCV